MAMSHFYKFQSFLLLYSSSPLILVHKSTSFSSTKLDPQFGRFYLISLVMFKSCYSICCTVFSRCCGSHYQRVLLFFCFLFVYSGQDELIIVVLSVIQYRNDKKGWVRGFGVFKVRILSKRAYLIVSIPENQEIILVYIQETKLWCVNPCVPDLLELKKLVIVEPH